jgi:hypothetical protein
MFAAGGGRLSGVALAAVNQALGITTLLVPAEPGLAAVSSMVLRGLGQVSRP